MVKWFLAVLHLSKLNVTQLTRFSCYVFTLFHNANYSSFECTVNDIIRSSLQLNASCFIVFRGKQDTICHFSTPLSYREKTDSLK